MATLFKNMHAWDFVPMLSSPHLSLLLFCLKCDTIRYNTEHYKDVFKSVPYFFLTNTSLNNIQMPGCVCRLGRLKIFSKTLGMQVINLRWREKMEEVRTVKPKQNPQIQCFEIMKSALAIFESNTGVPTL